MTKDHTQHIARLACLLALLALLVGIASIIVTAALHNRENINAQRITEGEYRLCERLNTVRNQGNESKWIQWLQLRQSATRSRRLAHTEPTARSIRLAAAKESDQLANRLAWTRLTNCDGAVHHPNIYRAPAQSPFSPANLVAAPNDMPLPFKP